MLHERNDYNPYDDDTPEAKIYRELLKRELADRDAVDRLLEGLTPADAHTPLFTHQERVKWNLKARRKRL